MQHRQGQKSVQLTKDDKAIVVLLLLLGFQQKRIAALLDVNQGRIAEINRQKESLLRFDTLGELKRVMKNIQKLT